MSLPQKIARGLPVVALALVAATIWLLFVPGAQADSEEVVTMQWGPITVPAANGGNPGITNNTRVFLPAALQPCQDCLITGMKPNLVYVDGSTVNFASGGMLHHAVFFNHSRDDTTCPRDLGIGELGERFFASGNERTIVDFPKHYGYYNGAGDTWVLLHDIMNFNDTPSEVYLQVTFSYVPKEPHMRHVTPVWLDQANCGDSEFPVPAGYSDTHVDWESTVDGKMVFAGGHVHNFGISTVLENTSTPGKHRVVCASVAGYADNSSWAPVGPGTGEDEAHPASHNSLEGESDYEGRVEDMSTCYAPPYGRARNIRQGDVLRLHAQYYAPKEQSDVMSIMLLYIEEHSSK